VRALTTIVVLTSVVTWAEPGGGHEAIGVRSATIILEDGGLLEVGSGCYLPAEVCVARMGELSTLRAQGDAPRESAVVHPLIAVVSIVVGALLGAFAASAVR